VLEDGWEFGGLFESVVPRGPGVVSSVDNCPSRQGPGRDKILKMRNVGTYNET